MPSKILHRCGELLASRKLTVATAESATAGRLAAEFSLLPQSGEILKGGLICYDAGLKHDVLGVLQTMLDDYTPESAEITREIASRLSALIKADIYIGITGLTTPGGSETDEKPVGTMFIHAVISGKHYPVRQVFSGAPEQIMLQCIDHVAGLIISALAD